MRTFLAAMFLISVATRVDAHELAQGASATVGMHALYHRVKDLLPLVDTLKLKMKQQNKPDTFSYYFDPATNALYSCIGVGDSTMCSGPERAKLYSWTKSEIAYGQKYKLLPTDRIFYGPEYFLEGATPFSQHSTYVFYSGEGKVTKCRKTHTSYNFELEQNGRHLFFQSEMKDNWVEQCQQVYPRPGIQ